MHDIRGALDMDDVVTLDSSEDENKERGNWSNRIEFILSCLGYAVGLGNVWRFPYLCYRNGGGAFFIPYFIMLFFCGIPLFFMEVSFGQFASLGPITIWRLSPIFKGVGYGMVFVSFLIGIYYNMIIAWSVFYLFASMQDPLPWSTCNHSWNTPSCTLDGYKCSLLEIDQLLNNSECLNYTVEFAMKHLNTSDVWLIDNKTIEQIVNMTKQDQPRSPSEEYFHIYVVSLTEGIESIGMMKWELVLCLLLAWILVFLTIIKGIKSVGKVVYFTATFPYVILTALFIRGVTLEGSGEGIRYYLTPQWHRLGEAQVWYEAGVQIFFSLSTCWGGLITLSSYNRFHNNCYRDAIIVSLGNCFTSIFSGFAIFSVIGVMAKSLGTSVDKVVVSDAGLAFIAYPEALSKMPAAALWAVLFFLMLIMIGIDTQFVIIETVSTAVMDEFPKRLYNKRILVNAGVCTVMFVLGLPLTTKGGIYLLQLMDSYAASFSVLVLGLSETIAISWVYGVDRFANDIKAMIGSEPRLLWKILWKFICPLMIMAILVFRIVDYSSPQYGDYIYPLWADFIGWMMACGSMILIPTSALYVLIKTPGGIRERFHIASAPTSEWGPALEMFRYYMACLPGMPNYGYADSSTVDSISIKERNRNLANTANMDRLDSLVIATTKLGVDKRLSCEIDGNQERITQFKPCRSKISSMPDFQTKYPGLPKVLYVGDNDDYILIPKHRPPVLMEDKCIQTDPTDESYSSTESQKSQVNAEVHKCQFTIEDPSDTDNNSPPPTYQDQTNEIEMSEL